MEQVYGILHRGSQIWNILIVKKLWCVRGMGRRASENELI